MVCEYYEIPIQDIRTKTRQRYMVRARQMFYLLMFENMHQISATACGKFMNQDHATVLHAINKMNDEISLYPDIKKDYDYFTYRLNGRFTPKKVFFDRSSQLYCNPCIYVRS